MAGHDCSGDFSLNTLWLTLVSIGTKRALAGERRCFVTMRRTQLSGSVTGSSYVAGYDAGPLIARGPPR